MLLLTFLNTHLAPNNAPQQSSRSAKNVDIIQTNTQIPHQHIMCQTVYAMLCEILFATKIKDPTAVTVDEFLQMRQYITHQHIPDAVQQWCEPILLALGQEKVPA